MASPLTLSEIESINNPKGFIAPDLYETPPDDLWTQCNIQFQVVASFVFDLPSDFLPNCADKDPTFRDPDWIKQKIKAVADPKLAKWITEDLSPIYVGYGNMGSCKSQFGGFHGKGLDELSLVDVNFNRDHTTTAHELGHALGLDHNESAANLMKEFGGPTDTTLAGWQCADARLTAKGHDIGYRTFNLKTGRTFRPAPPPVIGGTIPGMFDTMCCDIDGNYSALPSYQCGLQGGKEAAAKMCQVCCLSGGNVKTTWPYECPATAVQPTAMCESICCSNVSGVVSTYQCLQSGGHEVECPIEEPK